MALRKVLVKLLPAVLAGGLLFSSPESPASPVLERPPQAMGRVELVAGAGNPRDGGKAIDALVAGVAGMVVDPEGNLYFSDSGSNRVRKIDVQTGTIGTVAGNGLLISDEVSNLARDRALRAPGPLAIDTTGQFLFVGETVGRRVQRIDLATGSIQELPLPEGGGFGKITGLAWTPTGLVVTDAERGQIWKLVRSVWIGVLPEGGLLRGGIGAIVRDGMGHLYISEHSGNRILKMDTNSGRVTDYAGTGAALRNPDGLAFDAKGNLLVADLGNRRIVRIDAETQAPTTLYHSEDRGHVLDWSPGSLACDHEGNLWVGDVQRDRVLRFDAGAMQPAVIAGGADIGDGKPAGEAQLAQPGSVAADRYGNVYISDTLHHRVRVVDAATGLIHTVVGTGTPGYNGDGIAGTRAWLSSPAQLQVDPLGRVYIADSENNRVRLYDPASGKIITVAGNGQAGETGDGGLAREASLLKPHVLYLDGTDSLVVASGETSTIRRVVLLDGRIYRVPLNDPTVPADRVIHGLSRWHAGLVLVMPQPLPGSIDLLERNGRLTRLFGSPAVDLPYHAAVSPAGELFICDSGRNRVLRWTGKEMEVVARDLGRPRAISFDRQGNLLIADTFHNRVLRVYLHEPRGMLAATGNLPETAG